MKRRTESQARSVLRERLEARRPEIEEAVLARTSAIADPSEASDPAYAEGLRASVSTALTHGLEAIGHVGDGGPPVPVALLGQARLAARSGIPLDTVLRRYFAGYSLLGYFLIEEAGRDGLIGGAELQRLTATQAGRFDRLLAAIGEEHMRESEALSPATGERRRAERIERLLAGEPVDTAEIPYDFGGWHIGVAAGAEGAEPAIRDLAASNDCQLLLAPREDGTRWAWLGSRRRLEPVGLCRALAPRLHGDQTCTFGEPAEGLAGWRFTCRQAVAALPVAKRTDGHAVRYADIALLVSAAKDDLLTTSLRRLYLKPLADDRGGGETVLDTLHAYFAAESNVSSAAAALGVSRHTVNRHLQAAERRLGRPLAECLLDVELALRLRASGIG